MVDIDHLEDGMVLAKHVYLHNNTVMPLVTKGTVLTQRVIEHIKKRGIWAVYVKGQYDLDHIIIPTPAPVIDKEVQQEAIESLDGLFHTIKLEEGDIHEASAQIVKKLDGVVGQLITSIQKDQSALVNITDLKSYDEYTYHHSLSVAVLALAIGQGMGLGDVNLNLLGRCAMLHDIGKTAMPLEIINKPSRLDENEFAIIKTHPREGLHYLNKYDIGNEELRKGVLYHHEKYDGTGYPEGLSGTSIPLISRIISIGDVFDALTSNRSYRSPMQPSEAIEYIMGNAGAFFDFDIIEVFLEKIELYPVGCFIRLSNGEVAVVLENVQPMRPVVQLVSNGEVLDLFWDRSCLNLTILSSLGDRFVPDNTFTPIHA